MELALCGEEEAAARVCQINFGPQTDSLRPVRSQEKYKDLSLVEHTDLVQQLLLDLVTVLLYHLIIIHSQWIKLDCIEFLVTVLNGHLNKHVVIKLEEESRISRNLDSVGLGRDTPNEAKKEGPCSVGAFLTTANGLHFDR